MFFWWVYSSYHCQCHTTIRIKIDSFQMLPLETPILWRKKKITQKSNHTNWQWYSWMQSIRARKDLCGYTENTNTHARLARLFLFFFFVILSSLPLTPFVSTLGTKNVENFCFNHRGLFYQQFKRRKKISKETKKNFQIVKVK